MIHTKKTLDRALAVILSVMMIVAMLPVSTMQVFAATTGYEDVATFEVTDGTNPISGATVTFTALSLSATTDSNGIASFNGPTVIDTASDHSLQMSPVEVVVSKEGYETEIFNVDLGANMTAFITQAYHQSVQLTKIELNIPEGDYQITGFDGVYDGNEHAVSVVADGYTVKYSENNVDFDTTSPSITNVGSKKVYVQISKDGYKTVVKEITLKVSPAERTDFAFETASPADMDYTTGLSYTNKATSALEAENVTYKSSNENIATVDNNGKVTFLKAGTVQITATMSASSNYKESVKAYNVTVNTIPRTEFGFTTTSPSNITYGENGNKYTNTAVNADNDGTVTYSIVSQERDGKPVNDVAEIDKNTGELTILASGSVEIKAVVTAGDYYSADEATYTLTIVKAAQTGFEFETKSPENIAFNESITNKANGGQSTGTVYYEISSGEDVVSLTTDGKITAIGVGDAVIKAIKRADTRYEETSATYSITVVKADQTGFAFVSNPYSVDYGTKDLTVGVKGGQTDGKVTFSIESGEDIATIDSVTGKITFKTKKTGAITVKAVKDGDANYNPTSSTTVVNVERVDASTQYTLQGSKGENGWYIGTVKIVPASGYMISTSDDFDAEWKNELLVESEGKTSNIAFYLKKTSNNAISDAINTGEIKVDKTDPAEPVISYSDSVLDIILDTVSFGFYKEQAVVSIQVADDISGVDHIVYDIGNGDKTIEKKDIINGVAEVKIDPQYKGKITVKVYDEAGRVTSVNEEKVVVVDNVAPGVTVTYDPNNLPQNGFYYKADREVTIEIVEDNFYDSDVVITVGKRLDGETDYTDSRITPEFKLEGTNKYVAKYVFDENADYTFDISYTDKSGNKYDSYVKDEFTVDKKSPVISSTGIEDGVYYTENQVLNLKVEEHNFDAKDVVFTISAVDAAGETVDLSSERYAEYLKDNAHWSKTGDVYTAQISLGIEGQYTVKMTYKDLAGNDQVKEIDIPFFCVDKTNPNESSLKVTYSPNITEVILDVLTLGFYKESVTVTIEATDDISGIESFSYSYDVKQGVSDKNQGGSGVIKEGDPNFTRTGKKAVATFDIPAQFRGYVSFTAVDYAERNTSYSDVTNEIIVDSIAPGVTVKFPTADAKNTNYYFDKTEAEIIIDEANFDGSDVVITVGKRLNSETTYTESRITPAFVKSTEGDIYTATIPFNEDADYTFDITYTDKSDNVYNTYEGYSFTVDKIAPVINVKYDNNNVLNDTKFKAKRTATIEIVEHNFDAKDVIVKVTAKNAAGGDVSLPAVIATLTQNETWTKNGDTYTVQIPYELDADYTFSIEYTDLAGSKNEGVNYASNTKAPEEFTIDTVNPTSTIQIGNSKWSQEWTSFPAENNDDRSFALTDNVKVTVKVSNADELSGIDYVEYFKADSILTLADAKTKTWEKVTLTSGVFSFDVDPTVKDERFVIYVHIVDKAGNEHYVSSDGVIVDSTLPDIEKVAPVVTITPSKQPSDAGIYNGDVYVDVDVKDPISGSDVFSGLKSVTYKIFNKSLAESEQMTAEGTLFTFNNNAPQKNDLVQWLSTSKKNDFNTQLEQILVKSIENNSNDVVVEVIAIDNAGNKTVKSCDIKIDIEDPKIKVSYDKNNADSSKYFKEDRTATIEIEERNFNAKDVKITIKNSDGTIPTVSEWVKTEGTGNLDNTKWTAKVVYQADGDYTFDIQYTDLANNACAGADYGDSIAPTEFTIDHTIPTVEVTYDNNSVLNGNYYKAERTATIVITEHNLEPNGIDKDRVVVTLTATDDGKETTVPVVTAWTTNGDTHTATIHYAGDALYSFDIAIKDKAGNDSEDFAKQEFYVDKTAPTLTITGVANHSANNGDVVPVVSYSDTNYDADNVQITLSGANRKGVALEGSYADVHNGRTFTFKNFAKEKEIDDIYTLTATLTDKAGNTTTETITFSVNRFGSTYALSEAAAKLNGTYVKEPVDVVITETNANELSNIVVTIFKNNETIVLTEGTDYKIDVTGGNGQWYHYTYTILAKNFADDAVYTITVESDDAAGNDAKNDSDTKNTSISFGVDDTLPIINIENLESKTTYALDNMTVKMSIEDNLKLAKVIVELDGKEIKAWTAEELEEIVKNGGNFSFDISGESTDAHNLVVYAIDAAGNGEKISDSKLPENAEQVEDFYVTTNLWVRYYTNKPLFFGSIAGVILVAGLIVFLVVYKKKKNEGK